MTHCEFSVAVTDDEDAAALAAMIAQLHAAAAPGVVTP